VRADSTHLLSNRCVDGNAAASSSSARTCCTTAAIAAASRGPAPPAMSRSVFIDLYQLNERTGKRRRMHERDAMTTTADTGFFVDESGTAGLQML